MTGEARSKNEGKDGLPPKKQAVVHGLRACLATIGVSPGLSDGGLPETERPLRIAGMPERECRAERRGACRAGGSGGANTKCWEGKAGGVTLVGRFTGQAAIPLMMIIAGRGVMEMSSRDNFERDPRATIRQERTWRHDQVPSRLGDRYSRLKWRRPDPPKARFRSPSC